MITYIGNLTFPALRCEPILGIYRSLIKIHFDRQTHMFTDRNRFELEVGILTDQIIKIEKFAHRNGKRLILMCTSPNGLGPKQSVINRSKLCSGRHFVRALQLAGALGSMALEHFISK